MARFIFITGGVVSSLGKGLMAASLAALLQARGYKVRLRKLDPYLNVDPGTMSPYQHGEVYVTDDGAETDLDLGHYERFTGVPARQSDNVTSGRIYQGIITRERRGDYLGATVQVIPHVTNAIKDFIRADVEADCDFILCEVGGTVGDIESLPFVEAIRQFRNESPRGATLAIHTTLVPYIAAAGELKTKPTQHSVRELTSLGIQPEIIVCRCDRELPDSERAKISNFCNVRMEAVIPALDAKSIYAVPAQYHEAGLDAEVLRAFGIEDAPEPEMARWDDVTRPPVQPGRRGHDRRGRQICRPAGRLQVADRGARPRRPRQPRQGQHPLARRGTVRASRGRDRRRRSSRCTPSSSPAASASAAARARSPPSTSPAPATCPSSASASACRWPASRRRGTRRAWQARAPANSARPKSRSSA